MYGLYGVKHHIVEISGDVTDPDGRTTKQPTSKDRATQLLICEPLSFAIIRLMNPIQNFEIDWIQFKKIFIQLERGYPAGLRHWPIVIAQMQQTKYDILY